MSARESREDKGESKHDHKRRKSDRKSDAKGKAAEIAREAREDKLINECQGQNAKKVEAVLVCFLKHIMGATVRNKQEGLPGDIDKLRSLFELMQEGNKGAPYREYVVCGRQGGGVRTGST